MIEILLKVALNAITVTPILLSGHPRGGGLNITYVNVSSFDLYKLLLLFLNTLADTLFRFESSSLFLSTDDDDAVVSMELEHILLFTILKNESVDLFTELRPFFLSNIGLPGGL